MTKTVECPGCAYDIEVDGSPEITCPKCDAQFRSRIYIHVQRHEYQSPLLYAKAHLKAAEKLISSLA